MFEPGIPFAVLPPTLPASPPEIISGIRSGPYRQRVSSRPRLLAPRPTLDTITRPCNSTVSEDDERLVHNPATVAIDSLVRDGVSPSKNQSPPRTQFLSATHLYIWCGTFTAVNGRQSAWLLWGIHFKTLQRTEFSVELLVDGELGKRVCFEIYQGHLYVVSIIDQQESSFYLWSCYSPNHENNQGNGRLWRREHREGPINEMWAGLSIQVHEEQGRPVILECRREWLDGRSENHRTYYTTPLPTPDEALAMHTKGFTRPADMRDSGEAHSQLPGKRLVRDCHAEHGTSRPLNQRFDFIPAHTRHSSYHLAAAAYVDLVDDPKLQPDGACSQHRLRLRTKSREGSCAVDKGGVEHFDSRGVCLWPSEDAPSELLALLCPESSTSLVRAVCDERSLIYSTSADRLPPHHHMLVLINFDPTIRFPYLRSLRKQKSSTKLTRKVLDAPRPDLHWSHPLVRNAEAFYRAICYGYRP